MTGTGRTILAAGALLGLTSVIAGAAFSHLFASDHAVETALRYHQIYAVVVTMLGLLPAVHGRAALTINTAAVLFIAGTLCFSGGIYAASLFHLPVMIYATPVGGFLLMVGWIALLLAALLPAEPR
jgi:uncharacterized membrane protein YgdD (TMEM256/DUF423 family)